MSTGSRGKGSVPFDNDRTAADSGNSRLTACPITTRSSGHEETVALFPRSHTIVEGRPV
jgi:hypothetical protein